MAVPWFQLPGLLHPAAHSNHFCQEGNTLHYPIACLNIVNLERYARGF